MTARHVLDEVVARYTGSDSRAYLIDALGSVIAMAKEDQTVSTRYTYGPLGETMVEGEENSNATQYTSRENDGTGLYFYRARYYDPALKRFISEDPIGLNGVDSNLYAYVNNDPMSDTDPTGEAPYRGGGGGRGGGRWDNSRTQAENFMNAIRQRDREARDAWNRREQERTEREDANKPPPDRELINQMLEMSRLNGEFGEEWRVKKELKDLKDLLDPKNKRGACRP